MPASKPARREYPKFEVRKLRIDMAILSPSRDIIDKLHQEAEPGEIEVLEALMSLPDTYEIFFQSYLNGDRPDFVIVRKGGGVLLIEVKDWHLDHYRIRKDWRWELIKNNAPIKSPLRQVNRVKENLVSLHIQGLHQIVRNKPRVAQCIKCCVIFTRESTERVNTFLRSFEVDRLDKYENHVKYSYPLGYNSLSVQGIEQLMIDSWVGKNSYYFTHDVYNLFKRHFKSPIHLKEEGMAIPYSKAQLELMVSSPVKRKIKGAAGSGKTVVMAGRIVNAAIRTQGKVLVLTYNITLINYIKDRIRDVRETFHYASFDITNFHQWFKGEANNYNLEIESLKDWDDSNFFEPVKDDIKKYDAIFIDEVQDYHQPWLNMITSYFIKHDGEFVVFGDEKQNIYDNPLDDQKNISIPTVPGAWNRSLKHIYRFKGNLTKVAYEFQKLFGTKYETEDSPPIPELEFEKRNLVYYQIESDATSSDLVDIINFLVQEYEVHPGDATVMMSYINNLRELEHSFRDKMGEKTERTFASEESYQKLLQDHNGKLENEKFKNELRQLDRREKVHFYAKSGKTKFSTVHSFKGWESDTIILIIDLNQGGYSGSEEIIYTGLTRAKSNLFILNMGEKKYHSFFEEFQPD